MPVVLKEHDGNFGVHKCKFDFRSFFFGETKKMMIEVHNDGLAWIERLYFVS